MPASTNEVRDSCVKNRVESLEILPHGQRAVLYGWSRR